ncbi:peptidase C39 family protein [Vitiosangium sp. GDMCC 1.1324]|uniref:peptidase C39 family protein n=1 Tax=Vitiosangium sp. (strain GDMCC 1.1324) TaxID=2138576 RepID=UPI000D3A3AF4|nr:peptidase C39 family protein [Vitiosangium sp. GDMCC 1.1324]PTL80974.1 peptidase C39 family protein [Vitiosangium sp. GDMCC 1.1324]
MRSIRTAVVALCVTLTWAPAALAGQSAFVRWRASQGNFSSWQRSGVSLATDGSLQVDPQTAVAGTDPYAAGAYNGGNFYNGGSFRVGEATSPVMTNGFAFREAIASWEAETPSGTWVETQIRAQISGVWTKWYNLGVWAADGATVRRHSVASQSDSNGYVGTDTLIISNKKSPTVFQLKVRLFSADGIATPRVRASAVTLSTAPEKSPATFPGNSALWNQVIDIPQCSQMVYPDGGEVWCSPTSTSMVLGYWTGDTGACEPRVRAAVSGVYDWIYRGHGNWPFNTAYAATKGFQAHVTRFTGFHQLEPWIAAGVPAILSVAWAKGELTGAPIESTAGHLIVLVGFDAAGNPVVNDPAAASDATVRRTYLRSQLEPLWLKASVGTAYLIYPTDWPVPAL